MNTVLALDLPQKYLKQVQALLREYAPDAEVWAYGSRVGGGSHEASDLDLVLRNPGDLREESRALYDLKEAFLDQRKCRGHGKWRNVDATSNEVWNHQCRALVMNESHFNSSGIG